eukprot:Pgem_evm1s788
MDFDINNVASGLDLSNGRIHYTPLSSSHYNTDSELNCLFNHKSLDRTRRTDYNIEVSEQYSFWTQLDRRNGHSFEYQCQGVNRKVNFKQQAFEQNHDLVKLLIDRTKDDIITHLVSYPASKAFTCEEDIDEFTIGFGSDSVTLALPTKGTKYWSHWNFGNRLLEVGVENVGQKKQFNIYCGNNNEVRETVTFDFGIDNSKFHGKVELAYKATVRNSGFQIIMAPASKLDVIRPRNKKGLEIELNRVNGIKKLDIVPVSSPLFDGVDADIDHAYKKKDDKTSVGTNSPIPLSQESNINAPVYKKATPKKALLGSLLALAAVVGFHCVREICVRCYQNEKCKTNNPKESTDIDDKINHKVVNETIITSTDVHSSTIKPEPSSVASTFLPSTTIVLDGFVRNDVGENEKDGYFETITSTNSPYQTQTKPETDALVENVQNGLELEATSSPSSPSNIIAIAGGVVAGVCVLTIVVATALLIKKKKTDESNGFYNDYGILKVT